MVKRIDRTVFVGVSGGVDSSVSAALLKDQGYNVVGVFIRTWTPDFIECTWRDERRDAMRVCAHLNIPFLECDAEEEYKRGVADYMIEEYKKGRTPNPDVMCNREVKFGVFWNFAKAHGANFIATGHYVMKDLLRADSSFQSPLTPFLGVPKNGTPPPVASQRLSVLRKSLDPSKDQVYFLWTLTKEDLSHVLFPIGHLHKTDVRKLAKKYKIPVATKKDSQGVCFLGPLDMKDFLKHYIKPKKGEVILVPSAVEGKKEVIGYHNGATFFTLGERHGFVVTKKSEKDKPYYVVGKNIKNNTIIVADKEDLILQNNKKIKLININFTLKPDSNKKYQAQIRYHGEFYSCTIVTGQTCGNSCYVIFEENVLVDHGQSIVVYDNDICLGGGIVS